MSTEICRITFEDGSWIKAELPTDFQARIDYVLEHFGMFSEITRLPATDAAVRMSHIRANRARADANRAAVELIQSQCGGLDLRSCADVRRNVMRLRQSESRHANNQFFKEMQDRCARMRIVL